ncbi:hypothetical protein DPMN_178113 [Dreissena polymorpha]|uniref:Uncharacterized protein n=1 Tax=Dreissena polymorpha TaxID=45954 RepID=A0A9D4EA98_DREPO|nr:hypothetical protein DPMN_178113 [Dreissena polymorpha]
MKSDGSLSTWTRKVYTKKPIFTRDTVSHNNAHLLYEIYNYDFWFIIVLLSE